MLHPDDSAHYLDILNARVAHGAAGYKGQFGAGPENTLDGDNLTLANKKQLTVGDNGSLVDYEVVTPVDILVAENVGIHPQGERL